MLSILKNNILERQLTERFQTARPDIGPAAWLEMASEGGSWQLLLQIQSHGNHLLIFCNHCHPVQQMFASNVAVLRNLFRIAERLGVPPCLEMGSEPLDGIAEGIELFLRPLIHYGYNYEAPFYLRHSAQPSEPVYDFAIALHACKIHARHMLRSFAPVYIGRVAAFLADARKCLTRRTEVDLEKLWQFYDRWQPYLIERVGIASARARRAHAEGKLVASAPRWGLATLAM